jgi:ferric-dicitrate binding protein FerR (iron transport regulator)
VSEEHDDEYLWSKRGAPDPEIARLERLLARFAYRDPKKNAARRRAPLLALAAAALIAIALGAAWWLKRAHSTESGGYQVDGVAGVERLSAGDELAASSDARVVIGSLGDVRVDAGSRLRVDDDGERAHRLFLEHGKIHARILAKPRAFQVGTPAGLSVDLGCYYDLEVDPAGVTTLAVRTGRVAFETAGRKVLVPAGATCRSLPGRGPDTPVFDDASPSFVAAVRAVEFDADPDPGDVDRALELPRREDSLSLAHLLDAPSRELRARVFDRLADLYPLPEGVTREGVLGGDLAMRAAWRETMESDWR